jgi:hypothetical protein
MNMISVSSKTVARHIHRTFKPKKIDAGCQHYQTIENRIESFKDNRIYIQCIDADTGDNKQMSIYSPNPEGQIFYLEYQIYRQEVPINGYYGRFIYCIGMEDTKDDVKTVCILVLNQTTSGDELDGRPIFNYGAAMFYINIPLQKITTDQSEQILDTEFKKYIIQATKECDSFLESVKTISFSSGRLWEMPIQLSGYEMVYLSIHEPLSIPFVLNIILQRYDGIRASHILHIDLIPD